MSRRVVVRVPASTANVGAGFDRLGVAVDKWLTVSVAEERSSSISIQRAGTVRALDVTPDNDCVVIGFFAACAAAGRRYIGGLLIRESSRIQVARGLGSSAAATIAGATAANALLRLGLSDLQLATVCAQVEGRAGNVAAAIWGGAQLVLSDKPLRVSAIRVHPSIALVFSVPNTTVETTSPVRLASARDDGVRVPFKKGHARDYQDVIDAARRAGAYGAALSRSGSSIVAVAPAPLAQAVAVAMQTARLEQDIVGEDFVSAGQVLGCSSTLYQDCEKDYFTSTAASHLQMRDQTCQ